MKSKTLFIALYSVAFMFPSIGSVDTAVAKTDISHCMVLADGPAKAACAEAAASADPRNGAPTYDTKGMAKDSSAPAPFDDGLMGAPAMGAPGMVPGMGYAPGTAPGMAGQPAPGYLNNPTGGYAPGTAPGMGYAPGTAPGMGYAPGTQGHAPTGGYAPGTQGSKAPRYNQ
jgi:hypothetical protein